MFTCMVMTAQTAGQSKPQGFFILANWALALVSTSYAHYRPGLPHPSPNPTFISHRWSFTPFGPAT